MVVWLFALGASIGSFLNVVVYRLPARMSLTRPGSHCPACKRPIRWYDNVPMFSWIWLRGRCRDCDATISPRYPAVEATTAAMFVVLGLVEGLSGGKNLPLQTVPDAGQLAGMVTYHLLLVCTLLSAALIEYDGHRLPVQVVVPALAVGWLAPLVWPHLHPVPAWPALTGWAAGLADGTAGLALGLVLGLAVWRVIGAGRNFGFLLALCCVGLFLGWQAVGVLAALSVAVHLLFGILRRLTSPAVPNLPAAWLALATLVWILSWGSLTSRWPLLG